MKQLIFKIILIISLLLIFTAISAYQYSCAVSNNISEGVFRLHVIANSNSFEDQSLKYKVRDALISYMNSFLSSTSTKSDAINISKNNIDALKGIAQNIISENGYTYDVNIKIGNFDFPTKKYGDVSLPAGTYDAIRVEIGNAAGENWWCVMFPPLCFVDISSGIVPEESKNTLKDELSSESYDLITTSDSSNDINFKFKIVEFFENLKINIAKK